MIQTLRKLTDESRVYRFDFAAQEEITDGETIVSAEITQSVQKGPGGELTLGSPVITDANVKVAISDGVNNSDYLLHCRATLSSGSIISTCGILAVRDC